ncbi:hypothetical protein [Anaerocolumna aminovalerica]|uniref:hypothetical protein n=1 Tax=Anaerocolumna aminovalerica TaxID=1527 RepID=UPI000BE38A27|nr:hypothetical protein [Anaerocolumna aminovalerica]MBU5333698.1 hypothetical protein [Anaerocolumna aminovalerica]
MNKGTVFKYEIKRLLFSKEYLLLLATVLVYSVSLLRGVVLYGTDYTAPFSLLTFLTYCASLVPFLFILLLVLCGRQFKASDHGAESIISATPMPLHVFRLIRYSAVACAFLIAATLPVIVCFLFYQQVFDYPAFGVLLWPGLLFLLPPAILLFGAAMLLGNRREAAVHILLAAVLIVSVFQIKLPAFMDIIGSAAIQPLNTGEYDFALSTAFIAGRIAFSVVGVVLIVISLCGSKKRPIY